MVSAKLSSQDPCIVYSLINGLDCYYIFHEFILTFSWNILKILSFFCNVVCTAFCIVLPSLPKLSVLISERVLINSKNVLLIIIIIIIIMILLIV